MGAGVFPLHSVCGILRGMTEAMDNQDPRIIRQQTNSPEDLRIQRELNGLLTTEWSRKAITQLHEELVRFFNFSFEHFDAPYLIRQQHKKLLPRLAEIAKSKVATGEEVLEAARGKPAIIVTNHFGLGHLTIIDNKDKNFPIPLTEFAGFPIRLAALSILSEITGGPIYETAIELPPPLGELQEVCEVIVVPAAGENRSAKLLSDAKEKLQQEPSAMIVMYPEAGTTGKRNNGSPYDLDTFHSGAFLVAAQTGFSVIPICQYLNPESGMELHVLPPVSLTEGDLPRVKGIASETQNAMQEKLNSLYSR